jgi:hypothetical protein
MGDVVTIIIDRSNALFVATKLLGRRCLWILSTSLALARLDTTTQTSGHAGRFWKTKPLRQVDLIGGYIFYDLLLFLAHGNDNSSLSIPAQKAIARMGVCSL